MSRFTLSAERAGLGTWTRGLDLAVSLAVLLSLYGAFVLSPAERVQGEVFRLVYVHPAMAWMAYVAFATTAAASAGYLWRRRQLADDLARATAEVGVLFTTLALLTGAIWGRTVWGVWWTWDARLTSTLVLWFVYVGYLMVRSAITEPERAARIAAVVGVVGVVNIPIVQLSVTWWRTLHPEPSLMRAGALSPEMTGILALSALAFFLVFVRLVLLRMQLLRAQADALRLAVRLADRADR